MRPRFGTLLAISIFATVLGDGILFVSLANERRVLSRGAYPIVDDEFVSAQSISPRYELPNEHWAN